jgi:hypothetical protein
MDRCVQPPEKMLSHKSYWLKSLDMKLSECKTGSIFYTTAPQNATLIPLLTRKNPYFTHMRTWQCPSREAAEHYFVLSIIPIH